jgi:hypothetical protein
MRRQHLDYGWGIRESDTYAKRDRRSEEDHTGLMRVDPSSTACSQVRKIFPQPIQFGLERKKIECTFALLCLAEGTLLHA